MLFSFLPFYQQLLATHAFEFASKKCLPLRLKSWKWVNYNVGSTYFVIQLINFKLSLDKSLLFHFTYIYIYIFVHFFFLLVPDLIKLCATVLGYWYIAEESSGWWRPPCEQECWATQECGRYLGPWRLVHTCNM